MSAQGVLCPLMRRIDSTCDHTAWSMQASKQEGNRQVKGPRANNYGVDSNVPPDAPSKCVHLLDVEDLEVRPVTVLDVCAQCPWSPPTPDFCLGKR